MRHLRQGIPTVEHPVSPQDHPHDQQAAPVFGVRKELQQVLDAKDAHAHAQRTQAARVRRMRQGFSPEGQPEEPHVRAFRRATVPLRVLRPEFQQEVEPQAPSQDPRTQREPGVHRVQNDISEKRRTTEACEDSAL